MTQLPKDAADRPGHQVELETALSSPSDRESPWRLCCERSPDQMLLVGCDLRVQWDNRASDDVAGTREASSLEVNLSPDTLEAARAALRHVFSTGEPFERETTTRDTTTHEPCADDPGQWFSVRATAINPRNDVALLVLTDITQRRHTERGRERYEAETRHRQRLETISTMAGGVAHEINNPMQAIISCAELLLSETDSPSGTHELARDILGEANRVAKVVRDLTDFARTQRETFRAEPPAMLIERALV
ncbi:MAG: histidine kinase dimerization/phospho-acceptor domain-containing protein [Nannocystaceae bacterium]